MQSATIVLAAVAVVLTVLGSAPSASGHLGHLKRCPPPIGKYPFDVDKFAGQWFVVAKTEMPHHFPEEEVTNCHLLEYVIDSRSGNNSRFSLKIEKKAADKTLKPEVMGRFGGHDGAGGVSQVVWRPSADQKWKGPLTMSVLATDYETYAVSANCKEMYVEKTDSFERLLIGVIWSRKPELEAPVLAVLKNVLTGLGIEESTIKDLDNSGC